MTILLVDDELDTRTVARVSLKQLGGFDVIEAASGAQALDILSQTHVDAVVLDVMMPGLDGPAVLQALRANPAWAKVPVVFLTAKAMPDEIQRLKAMGVAAIHTKPFDPATLAADMRRLLAPPQAATASGDGGEGAPAIAARVDGGALGQLMGLTTETGADLMGALIDLFEANTPQTVATLRELSSGPAESGRAVERVAHTLKGAAATLGAVEIADLARRIEEAARTNQPLDMAPLLSRIADQLAPTVRALRVERARLHGIHPDR